MRIKAFVVLALMALGLSLPVKSQEIDLGTLPTPAPAPAGLINGSQTPEQIPLSIAFRQWAIGGTKPERLSELPQRLILSTEDASALMSELTNYRAQVVQFQNDFHATVSSAVTLRGTVDDGVFYNNTYNQVSTTLLGLQASMTPEGYAKFVAFLEDYKKGMLVSPYDLGLGAIAERNRAEATMVAGRVPPTGGTDNYTLSKTAGIYFPDLKHGQPLDSFARANNSTIGSNWTQIGGTFGISSNAAVVTNAGSGGTTFAYYHNWSPAWTTAPQSNMSIITLTAIPGVGAGMGGGVRMSGTSTSNLSGYFVYFDNNGSQKYLTLQRIQNGSPTNLQYYTYTMAVGDIVRLNVIGNSVEVWLTNSGKAQPGNEVIVYTDPSPLPGGYPGIVGTANSGGLKNWIGGGGITVQTDLSFSGNTINGHGTAYGNINNDIYTFYSDFVGPHYPSEDYIEGDTTNDWPQCGDGSPVCPTGGGPINLQVSVTSTDGGNENTGLGPYRIPPGMPLIWGAVTYTRTYATAPGGEPSAVSVNCSAISTPPDYFDPVPWTIINIANQGYEENSVCNLLLWFITGSSCESSTLHYAFLTTQLTPGPCTSKQGQLYPRWVAYVQ